MMLNNKGQGFGWIRVLFFAGFFLVLFGLALAPFVSQVTGAFDFSDWGSFGSWVVTHLNLWFFSVFVVGVLILLVYGWVGNE